MKRLVRGIRIAGSQAGFSLAELLAAVFVISLGLVAVGAGFATAIQGVETSRQQTTATFLAEQRLEQALALDGNQLQPHVLLGIIEAREGRYADAIERWERVKARAASWPNIDRLIEEARTRQKQ